MSHHEGLMALFSYVLQSGLILAVGLIVPRLLRLRHPRTLLVYWRSLFLAAVLLPVAIAVWQPKTPLPMLSLDGAAVEEVVASTLRSDAVDLNWPVLLAPVLLVTLLGLGRIIVGLIYLGRCRRAATLIVPLPDRVGALQRRLGLEVPLAATDRLSVPITFGWARPIVMVPMSFNRLSEDEQEGVACHEFLHIHRRDWPVALAEEIVRAMLWFHPAVWLLLPRIALSREQVVDAGTVALTGKRRQYLDALWQIVVSSQKPAAAVAVPLVGRSHLRARVECLKKEIAMSKTRIIASVVVLVASVAVAAMVGAAAFSSSVASGEPHAIGDNWSPQDDKPAEDSTAKKKSDSKLETVNFDGECSEITHPEAIEKVNPTYPEEARKARTTGIVVLRSTISEKGVVEDLEVLESADDLLSMAAVEAVQQWRFKPAQCDGKDVGVYYNLTIKFNLK